MKCASVAWHDDSIHGSTAFFNEILRRRFATSHPNFAPSTGTELSEPAGIAPLRPPRPFPDDTWKALERDQRAAAIGPFGHLVDRDVIARLAIGAAVEDRARDIHHLRR